VSAFVGSVLNTTTIGNLPPPLPIIYLRNYRRDSDETGIGMVCNLHFLEETLLYFLISPNLT